MAHRHTHLIEYGADSVRKTYRSWDRDEHRREWQTLSLLHTHRPGVAPRPIESDLAGDPPSITMSMMPGEPIAGRWTEPQLDALAEAVEEVWSTPPDGLAPIPVHDPNFWSAMADRSTPPSDEIGLAGYRRAREWIGADGPAFLGRPQRPVLGQGDPQIGNLLYDSATGRIGLIDFEDSGPSDLCLELANFAEHLGNRDTGLDGLADRFDVDQEQLLDSRRLWAAFWVLHLDAPARAADRTDQALRFLSLVDGSDR